MSYFKTTIDGMKAKHFTISNNCRKLHGDEGAIEIATEGIKEGFRELCEGWKGREDDVKFNIVLTIVRPAPKGAR